MDPVEERLAEFLAESENLGLAYDVWKTFPDVLNKLQTKFWESLLQVLKGELGSSEGWVPTEYNNGLGPLNAYYGLQLVPPDTDPSKFHLRLAIEQDKSNFELYVGILYSHHPEESPEEPESLVTLRDSLSDHQGWKTSEWWLKFRMLDLSARPRNRKEVQQFATSNILENLAKHEFIELFKMTKGRIISVNRDLMS